MKNKKNTQTLLARKKKALRIVSLLSTLYPRAGVFLHHRNSWELLVAVMLSAQCTDKKVNEVTEVLFTQYPTFSSYLSASPAAFSRAIHATGFYNTKSRNILRTANIIHEQFNNKVPRTMEELISLPGVGRKTANIILESAFNIVVGIPVDTHVRRLSRVWGLTTESNPDKIEQDLMEIIPQEKWRGLSYRIVSYGREYCPARKHAHEMCPVSKIKV
jgi:endonuclease-3